MEKKQIILDKFGMFLSKHSGRLRVKHEGNIIEEIPLIHLDSVIISSRGVSLSSDVIEVCAERGIDVVYISGTGSVYGRLTGPQMVGTVKTRREQLYALSDRRGVHLGKAFALGKINNQRNIIKYYARYRKTTDRELFSKMEDSVIKLERNIKALNDVEAECIDDVRETILNIEGRSASIYWDIMTKLVGEELGWEGREGRGATDPVNSALNYSYAILYGQVERAILLAGLDPFAGFVHTDRAGKPSLVFDLIEEFRQQVVDRVVFGMLGKGSNVVVNTEGMLDEKTRKTLSRKIFDRLNGEERCDGMKQRIRTIILRQAQSVAGFVRGDKTMYKPYVGSW